MIFVDTGAWYALESPDDRNHRPAAAFLRELSKGRLGAMVTTDYVLDETLTLLSLRFGAAAATIFLAKIRESESVDVVWVGEQAFWEAAKLLEERPDKKWSFTDCTSFVAMRSLNVDSAFTFDDNFQQAGFKMLPGE
jgi:predicted nucleic acid-binding protein